MRIIGITGPTGAGKSLLRAYAEEQKLPCIDADGLYHSMLEPPSRCLDAIRKTFGDGLFAPDGTLDRAKLSQLVFSSPKNLELLNSTVLEMVLDEMRHIIANYESSGEDTVVIDAPTLIESGFHKECDVVISVIAPADIRLERIKKRDSLSDERAALRVNAQQSNDFYTNASTHVLINDKDADKLRREAEKLFEKLNIGRRKVTNAT